MKTRLQKDDAKAPGSAIHSVNFRPPKPVSIHIAAMAT
jgi:hypothetical protein